MELTVGLPAPALELPLEGGGTASAPARGAPQLLFFFKVDCPTSALAVPALERLRRAHPRLELLPISQDDAAGTRAWRGAHGLTARAAIEGETFPASAAFGLAVTPTLVLLDSRGAVAAVQEGWSREGYNAAAALAARLLGEEAQVVAPEGEGPAFRPG